MKTYTNNLGFSLIEILLSIAVAAVILPGIVILLSLSTFTTSQGENYTKAYSITQREMEKIYAMKRSDWDNIIDSCPVTEEIFTICQTVTVVHDDEKNVNISVSWDERGETASVEVEGYVVNY